ncbi:hypothetical protein DB42_CO00030 [Neochlamydia sp. EPS4]|uniref:DUF294 nucleotidyltransferase-like domain-containing protein n=1 Tax=Neochlamydia sp. EPS4 TaxID=1478175 RepID=UPI000583AE01|nr:DUF294 nucleotidyltransferase-like domain-containing protein [Neochlamydia sp. EPS4]KIC72968.1 hypothetical protein DB42_CO00030 [Neochlamydia sp. EPS4]
MIPESSLLRPVVFRELKAREEHLSLSLENSIKYRKIDLKICAELSSQDLCGLRLACKEWKQIAQATDLGKRLFSKKSSFFSPLSSKIYEQLLLSFDNLTPEELKKIIENNDFLSKASIEKAEKAYMLALKLIIKDKDSAQEAAQQSISTQESFCIEKLGDIYVAKGTPKTLLQAAGLYNYVMSLSPIENRELLKEKLAKIHNLLSAVSEEKPLNYNLLKNQFEGNRQKLKDFRSKIEKHIQSLPETPDHQVVRELFGEITQQIKAFFEILVKQSVDALGAEPCEYAMIGFGSLAREEVTPYSDLEFGILIKEDNPINREYFKRLTSLIHLKVINLGETILPALNIPCLKAIDFFDSITPRGFAFDGAGVEGKGCKTPFGNGKTFELIQTPEKMAQYVGKNENGQWWHDKEPHLSMELLNFTHLLGNNELTEQYRQKVQEKLNIPYLEDINLRQHLAKYHLVQEDMIAFNPGMGDLGRQGMLFKVKNDFYRFPHLALDRLALLKEIVASDTFGRIDQLNKLGVITEGAAAKLKEWMSIALFMRLRTYSHYQAQQETMNPLIKPFEFDEPELIKQQFALDQEALEKVKKIYCIFIPFYQAIQEFLAGDEKRLAFSDLEDNSFKTQGDISLRLFQLKEAKSWYIRALQENRESIKALEALASINKTQGNLEQAAYYADQGVEIIRNQCNRKHSNLANFYNLLGMIFKDRGNFS